VSKTPTRSVSKAVNEGRDFNPMSCDCHLNKAEELLPASFLTEQFAIRAVWGRDRATLLFLCEHSQVVLQREVYPESEEWLWITYQTHDFRYPFIPVVAKAA
jgi:hypothetical protein